MPRNFIEFLHFHKYDVIFIVQGLAQSFFLCGDLPTRKHTFSIIEVWAISERLKIPCPPLEYCTKQYDFSHILDFCSKLKSLTIIPHADTIPEPVGDSFYNKNNGTIETCIGTSNIIPKSLKFELSAFKSLKNLIIREISTENIYHAGTLRETLEKFFIYQTNIDELNKILLCDDIHKHELRVDGTEKVRIFLINFFIFFFCCFYLFNSVMEMF